MPAVTGTLTDIAGGHLGAKYPGILFTLNGPNSNSSGVLFPTEPSVVTPAADGTWTANLPSTTDMMDDAYYSVSIRWLDPAGNYIRVDFPDWKLVVPTAGGKFSDLFGRPRSNQSIVYVSLTAPAKPVPFMLWLEQNPDNPADPLNTGRLYQWSK